MPGSKITRVISIANQKGGVGKTSTTHNLAAGLVREGHRVLVIDMDPQMNLSACMFHGESDPNLYHLLTQQISINEKEYDVINVSNDEKTDVILASKKLSRIDIELAMEPGKEYRLRDALESITSIYDYVIIDTPPALGTLTVNALTAANEVIIPCQADLFSLQGLRQIFNTISIVKKHCNPTLAISGILLVRHNPRTVLSRDLSKALEKMACEFGTKVYKTTISECVAVKEAQVKRMDIFAYKPHCSAAMDYASFIEEVLEDGKVVCE